MQQPRRAAEEPFVVISRIVSTTLAGLIGGCAYAPLANSNCRVQRVVALRVDEAACLAAHALRLTLPLADPRPYAGGAPATRLDRDTFEIGYDRFGAQWLPVAQHRLVDRGAGCAVVVRPATELPGYGLRAEAAIRLEVTTADEPTRAIIRGALPRELAARFEDALTSQLARRSNLAPAERAARAARELANAGDLPRARHHRDHAILATTDPLARAELLNTLNIPGSAQAARQSARDRIGTGDHLAARALVHTASRIARAPALDYQLLWQLHNRTANTDSAFAAALLLREHARYGLGENLAILELQAQGLADLVERSLALDPQYLSRHGAQALPAATPPRDE